MNGSFLFYKQEMRCVVLFMSLCDVDGSLITTKRVRFRQIIHVDLSFLTNCVLDIGAIQIANS